jgi:hypothetical protein
LVSTGATTNRTTRTNNGAMKGQSVVLRITEAKRQAIELAEWHARTNKCPRNEQWPQRNDQESG